MFNSAVVIDHFHLALNTFYRIYTIKKFVNADTSGHLGVLFFDHKNLVEIFD